jgi:hypothetical protein
VSDLQMGLHLIQSCSDAPHATHNSIMQTHILMAPSTPQFTSHPVFLLIWTQIQYFPLYYITEHHIQERSNLIVKLCVCVCVCVCALCMTMYDLWLYIYFILYPWYEQVIELRLQQATLLIQQSQLPPPTLCETDSSYFHPTQCTTSRQMLCTILLLTEIKGCYSTLLGSMPEMFSLEYVLSSGSRVGGHPSPPKYWVDLKRRKGEQCQINWSNNTRIHGATARICFE